MDKLLPPSAYQVKKNKKIQYVAPSFIIQNYSSYRHLYERNLKISPTMIERYEYMFDNLRIM